MKRGVAHPGPTLHLWKLSSFPFPSRNTVRLLLLAGFIQGSYEFLAFVAGLVVSYLLFPGW